MERTNYLTQDSFESSLHYFIQGERILRRKRFHLRHEKKILRNAHLQMARLLCDWSVATSFTDNGGHKQRRSGPPSPRPGNSNNNITNNNIMMMTMTGSGNNNNNNNSSLSLSSGTLSSKTADMDVEGSGGMATQQQREHQHEAHEVLTIRADASELWLTAWSEIWSELMQTPKLKTRFKSEINSVVKNRAKAYKLTRNAGMVRCTLYDDDVYDDDFDASYCVVGNSIVDNDLYGAWYCCVNVKIAACYYSIKLNICVFFF